MTKKHFRAIAEIFRSRYGLYWHDPNISSFNDGQKLMWIKLRMDLADYFKFVNPRFDVDEFYQATDPEQEENNVS